MGAPALRLFFYVCFICLGADISWFIQLCITMSRYVWQTSIVVRELNLKSSVMPATDSWKASSVLGWSRKWTLLEPCHLCTEAPGTPAGWQTKRPTTTRIPPAASKGWPLTSARQGRICIVWGRRYPAESHMGDAWRSNMWCGASRTGSFPFLWRGLELFSLDYISLLVHPRLKLTNKQTQFTQSPSSIKWGIMHWLGSQNTAQ